MAVPTSLLSLFQKSFSISCPWTLHSLLSQDILDSFWKRFYCFCDAAVVLSSGSRHPQAIWAHLLSEPKKGPSVISNSA